MLGSWHGGTPWSTEEGGAVGLSPCPGHLQGVFYIVPQVSQWVSLQLPTVAAGLIKHPCHLSFLLRPPPPSPAISITVQSASGRTQPRQPAFFFSGQPYFGLVISPPKEPHASGRLPLPIPGSPHTIVDDSWAETGQGVDSSQAAAGHRVLPAEPRRREGHQGVLSRKRWLF